MSAWVIYTFRFGNVAVFITQPVAFSFLHYSRNRASGKRLLGFLPNIKVRTAFRDSSYVQAFRRTVMRSAMAFIFKQILEEPYAPKNMALGASGAHFSTLLIEGIPTPSMARTTSDLLSRCPLLHHWWKGLGNLCYWIVRVGESASSMQPLRSWLRQQRRHHSKRTSKADQPTQAGSCAKFLRVHSIIHWLHSYSCLRSTRALARKCPSQFRNSTPYILNQIQFSTSLASMRPKILVAGCTLVTMVSSNGCLTWFWSFLENNVRR